MLTDCSWVRVPSAKRLVIYRSSESIKQRSQLRGLQIGGYDTSKGVGSGDDDSGAAWQRVRLQAFINSGGESDYNGD